MPICSSIKLVLGQYVCRLVSFLSLCFGALLGIFSKRKDVNVVKNQKVKVKDNAPFHCGRVGYLQSDIVDGGEDIVVICSEPQILEISLSRSQPTYFAVHKDYIEEFL